MLLALNNHLYIQSPVIPNSIPYKAIFKLKYKLKKNSSNIIAPCLYTSYLQLAHIRSHSCLLYSQYISYTITFMLIHLSSKISPFSDHVHIIISKHNNQLNNSKWALYIVTMHIYIQNPSSLFTLPSQRSPQISHLINPTQMAQSTFLILNSCLSILNSYPNRNYMCVCVCIYI